MKHPSCSYCNGRLRNSSPIAGHVVPDEFREPLAGEEEYKPGLHPHYDLWRQIQRKEEVWGPLIQRHGLSHRVKVLNVSFTDVRGDAHVNKRLVALDQLEVAPPMDRLPV